ncbi:CCA tRNA nucleotidyltransferase [Synechococcus sp. RSCCF101]|nr:CCA tRNA nucleotidyltransferase [Synechococcus sp. RSCCF101]
MARELWSRLRPGQWPVPPEAFPAGSALVGGAVRDALLERRLERPDLDVVVPVEAVALCRGLARDWGGTAVVLDASRSMARLVLGDWTIDMARQEGPSLEHDLRRRDYSVNAIAVRLPPSQLSVVDPCNGLQDGQAQRLRAVSQANLMDDPLRLLRGLRLAAELSFSIETRTWRWIRMGACHLRRTAPERVLMELQRLVAAPLPASGIGLLIRSGLLRPWERRHTLAMAGRLDAAGALERGLQPVEIASALPLARLALMLSGEGLSRLKASRRLQQRCRALQRWLPSREADAWSTGLETDLAGWEDQRRLRLQRELEQDLPAWLLLAPTAMARRWMERWRDAGDPLFHPGSPLDGRSLQASLGLEPSPRLGQVLDHLTLERAFGRIREPAEALLEAQRFLDRQSGSTPAAG